MVSGFKTVHRQGKPVLALAAGLGVALACGAAGAQTLNIGTLPQGSLAYSIAATAAKVIADKTDLRTRAIGFGGSNIYAPMLNQGKLDITTSNSLEGAFAISGTQIFEGKKMPNYRVLAKLFTFQTGFMVPKDSKIQKLTDFKGKKFPSGFSSQQVVNILVSGAFAAEGMSWKDIQGVPMPNFIRATEAMTAGRVTGSFLAVGSGVVRKANASGGIRFISIEATPEKEKIMAKVAPGTYYTTVNPSKRLPYITKPTTMVGFDYLLAVGAHVKDEVVYKVAKALYENKKALIEGHGVYRGFQPKQMVAKVRVAPYHPGAIKFYKEVGLWTDK